MEPTQAHLDVEELQDGGPHKFEEAVKSHSVRCDWEGSQGPDLHGSQINESLGPDDLCSLVIHHH